MSASNETTKVGDDHKESAAPTRVNQSGKSFQGEGSNGESAKQVLENNATSRQENPKNESASRQEILREVLGSPKEKPVDLSESYSPDDRPWAIDHSTLAKWLGSLLEYRVLVLQSALPKALNSAAASLINKEFKRGKKRCWNLHRAELQNATALHIAGSGQKSDSDSLFIVSGEDGFSTQLLISLPEDPSATLTRRLEEKNAYMLILVRLGQLDALPEDRGIRASQYLEEVPWLRPMLQAECPDEASSYYETIIRLGSRWPFPPGKTYALAKNRGLEEAFKSLHENEPSHLPPISLCDGEIIENTIKFIVCYFGGNGDTSSDLLSPDDFQYILCALLADQTVAEPSSIHKDTNGNIIPIVKRPLVEIWKAESQTIVAKCGVRVDRDPEHNSLYVDFLDARTRALIVRAFDSAYIWTRSELCSRVALAGLLFEERPSLRGGAVKLALQQIENDPRGYGRSFLTTAVNTSTPEVAEPLSHALQDGLAALLDAAAMKGLAEPIRAALTHFADSKRVLDAWRLSIRFQFNPRLSRVFTDLLKRVLEETPADLERDEAVFRAMTEQLSSFSLDPTSSGPAFKEMLSWGISTRASTGHKPDDYLQRNSEQFAYKLLFRLHGVIPLPLEVQEMAWRLLLEQDFEKWFDAEFPRYENVLVYFVEWIIGLPLNPLPEAAVLAVALDCLQTAFEGFPKTLTPSDTTDFLRATFASRWIAREPNPEEQTAARDLLIRLIPSSANRRKIRDSLQVLSNAAAAGIQRMDSIKWEGPEQRKQRLQLQTRLRDVRDSTRLARQAFSL